MTCCDTGRVHSVLNRGFTKIHPDRPPRPVSCADATHGYQLGWGHNPVWNSQNRVILWTWRRPSHNWTTGSFRVCTIKSAHTVLKFESNVSMIGTITLNRTKVSPLHKNERLNMKLEEKNFRFDLPPELAVRYKILLAGCHIADRWTPGPKGGINRKLKKVEKWGVS